MKKNRCMHGLGPCVLKMLRIMKLSVLMMLISVTGAFASEMYSQTTKLSLKVEAVSLEDFLIKIENMSEFRFFYTGKIDVDKKVSGEFKNQIITDILDGIKEEAGINYEVMGRQVILSPNNAENAIKSIQQQKNITGMVTDETGEPLPGVNVYEKSNPQKGVITGGDGSYSITVSSADAVLVYSFIGMDTQEIIVGSKTVIDVEMTSGAIKLDEVVAIGYGQMKRRDLAGSIASVRAEDIDVNSQSSITDALAGRAAGVQITSNDGSPGGKFNIRIRGVNSINGSSDPLYVVDDIIGVDPSTIDPAEIKSIEVLKDASATAIYGSQGANGVIIMTTNNFGLKAHSEINASYTHGVSKVTRQYDMLNGGEYYKMGDLINPWSLYFGGWAEKYPDVEGVNWQDEIMQVGSRDDLRVSASGNSGKTQYYLSGGYNSEKGIVKETGYDRLNFKVNGQHTFSPKVTVRSSFDISNQHRYGDGVNGMYGIYLTALKASPHSAYGDVKDLPFGLDENGNPIKTSLNPLVHLENLDNDTYTNNYRLNAEVEYKPLAWMKFVIRGSKNDVYTKQELFEGANTINGSWLNGQARLSSSTGKGYSNDNLVFIDPKLGEKHKLSTMLGFTQQGYEYTSLNVSSSNFANDVLGVWGLPSGADQKIPRVDKYDWRLHSVIGRLSYGYNNRLNATVTFRGDGSSKFGEGNKWGWFPSAALAYRLSELDFIKNLNVFSNFKVRASYGVNGSQGIQPYGSLAKYALENYTFDNAQQSVGVYASALANPDLKWEKTAQTDLGVEIGLFNGRLNLEADYYIKKTSDLLYAMSMPLTSGYNSYITNIGEVENRGFEFSLIANVLKSGDFNWSTNFNIAFNKNKVLKLNGETAYKIIDSPWDYTQNEFLLQVGNPIGEMYGYVWEGLYQLDDFNYDPIKEAYTVKGNVPVHDGIIVPGGAKYKDINGDGVVNDGDRTVIGNGNPDFFGGFSNSFSYKGLKLDVLFTYSYGAEVFNMTRLELQQMGAAGGNKSRDVLDYWTVDNHDASFPAPGIDAMGPVRQVSTRYIEDASYLRLKTLSLSYSLPKSMLDNVFVKDLELAASATNLWTLTDYTGSNPEASTSGYPLTKGIEYGTYPTAKSVNLTMKLKF